MSRRSFNQRHLDQTEVGCTRCDWTGWRRKGPKSIEKPCPAVRRNGTICGGRVGWI